MELEAKRKAKEKGPVDDYHGDPKNQACWNWPRQQTKTDGPPLKSGALLLLLLHTLLVGQLTLLLGLADVLRQLHFSLRLILDMSEQGRGNHEGPSQRQIVLPGPVCHPPV